MVDNSTPILGPVTVWTLPAVGTTGALLTANAASFPWGWGWAKEPLLIATGNRFTKRPGAMGAGSFTILRDQRQEPDDSKIRAFNSPLVAGQYVCVTADAASADANQLHPALVLWWGWISSISYSQLRGTLDGVGTATALEVGHLLDQQQVVNWLEASADGLSGEPVTAPPTANLGDSASYIVGNATPNVGIGSGGDLGYAFTRRPDDCGNATGDLWTRWRLLRHLLYGCWPGGLPVPTLACADGSEGAAGPQDNDPAGGIAGFLNDTAVPEVYDLRNLTLKGAIDLCVPRSRGFNWTLELIDTKGWQVVIYSYATLGGSGGLPVNGTNSFFQYISPGIGTDLTVDSYTTDVKVVSDSGTMPDEVVVEGSPIVIGNTVGFPDRNLAIGWQRGAGNQEDAFRLGASTAADYSSLTPDQKKERNASVRTGAGLRDVYTRYGLYAYDGNDDITVAGLPGAGFGGGRYFLCPQLNWDGAALKIDPAVSRCPYLPASTLARTLPWPEGVKGDGTDQRPVQNRYLPQFLKPKVLRYDATEPIPWVDFEAQNGRSGYPSMSLDVDDRGMAFRITLSSPIYLAYRHWTDAAGGTTTPASADIDPDIDPNSVDYTTLIATVGVESDQRVRVAIKRPGVTSDAQIRRRLVLREPSLQCWIMRTGSIIGLLPDGTPERVTSGGADFPTITGSNGDAAIAIRNDFPAAQKRCDMAAAWAFRERNSVIIQRAAPDSPPEYARIGYLVTNLIEKGADRISGAASLTVNTVVEEVSYDFTMAPRITIATAMPEMIGFAAIGGGGTGGGSVSAMLGGTVGQAVQTQQQTTAALNRDTQRVPVISPQFSPKVEAAAVSLTVHQVSHGLSYGKAVFGANGVPWAAISNTVAGSSPPVPQSVYGIVVNVIGPDDFVVGLSGQFDDPTNFFSGTGLFLPWYLTSTAGVLSQTFPQGLGTPQYSRAMCIAIAANKIYIYGEVSLANNQSLKDLIDTRINYSAVPAGLLQPIAAGDVLTYKGSNEWWNQANTVANLADVTVASPANGDSLIYDTASTKWKNTPGFTAATRAADSVYGRSAGTAGVAADIVASADNQALVRVAGALQFASLPVAAIANVAATTVLGNATNASAAVTAIAAAADNTVMLRTGGVLSFAAVPNAALANSSVTVTPGTGLSGGGAIALGGSATLNVAAVPNSALVNSSITISGTLPIVIGGSGQLGGTTTVAINDATTSAKGVVQLAGDLAGTASAPVVGAHKIDFTKLAQSAALSVVCNPTNAIADTITIAASSDGQVLMRQGGALSFSTAPLSFANQQFYSASGTFTVPAGVYSVFAVLTGSGGGSSGTPAAATLDLGSGPGGGGAVGMGFIPVVPGQVLTVTIGAAGTAGASGGGSGGNGGSSSITGSLPTVNLVANGGKGGTLGVPGAGGAPQSSYNNGQWGLAGHNGTSTSPTSVTTSAGNITGITCVASAGGPSGGSVQGTQGYGGGPAAGFSATGTAGLKGGGAIYY